MRRSLATIPARFNTDRMLRDYHELAYDDLARQSVELSADKRAALKELVREESRVRKGFADVAFVSARMADLDGLRMGDTIDVHGELELGTLAPGDVEVELVIREEPADEARELERVPLPFVGKPRGGVHAFEGSWRLERSGRYSYGIRARARTAGSLEDALGDLVLWA